ncbi:TetR family transcriptional regulator [Azospirillum cavernae]|uniref:TetR family transcriptional regulator n=1 Tax=Azospirillum cavernae TaxID=2320860 RepID=A0A418VM57_9PROT|nr:TetR/AcrR family transcriptional regulator [Azospirillum cavernae]RJF77258.1 TetR family transcriptional regulator [Azospirillum cavernae]
MKQDKKARSEDLEGSKRPHGGRPTLKEAEQLHGRILDVATELFTKHGYGETSIEAIAASAGIGKLTLYRRFGDKDALFQAVALRMSEQSRSAMAAIGENNQNPSDALTEAGSFLLNVVLSPQSVAFHRIVFSEAARLPELCASMHQDAPSDRGHPIRRIILRFAEQGVLDINDVDFLTHQFVQAVIGNPLRKALLGGPPMSAQARQDHVRKTVALFLRGAVRD